MKTLVVKFDDGQIMIHKYEGDTESFKKTLVSYSGCSSYNEIITSEEKTTEEILAILYSETKFILKLCPKYKNISSKLMIGKFWLKPDEKYIRVIKEKVLEKLYKGEFKICKKKPAYFKNDFSLVFYPAKEDYNG